MTRRLLLPSLLLAGCAHPEDRRWDMISPAQAALDHAWKPAVSVYSFATSPETKPVLGVKDLTGEGQAAYVAELVRASDPKALRTALATPIAAPAGIAPYVAPALDRTLVIDVQKPVNAALGDRIVRSVVTIVPAGRVEFASYAVVATDTQVQNIAHLETASDASLEGTLAPTIKGFGENAITAKIGKTHTTSADITASYQKLDVQITPALMAITRESERGTDTAGNTLVKLKLALPLTDEGQPVFLGTDQSLFNAKGAMSGPEASLDLSGMVVPRACPIVARVSMKYLMRRVEKGGSRYYTEGKQQALYVADSVEPFDVELVRAAEVAPRLWQVTIAGSAVMVAKPGTGGRRLAYNSYDAAQAFAEWLKTYSGSPFANGNRLVNVRGAQAGAEVTPLPNGC